MSVNFVTCALRRSRCLATLALASLAALACGCESPSPSSPLASGAVDEPVARAVPAAVSVPLRRGSVRLANAVHPYARPENDQGRLDPDQRIANLSLFFKLSPEQRRDRDALVAAQLNPSSPEYRHWLTPEDYAARFGARAPDIAAASDWLKAQGFTVHRTSRLGTRVTFSARVGDLESAFQTEMHHYVVGGETHYAMATAPAFPEALADVVLGLHNTHDFYPKPVSHARAAKRTTAHFQFSLDGGLDGGPLNVLGPPDWALAYDVDKLYDPGIGGTKLDGTGVTIGIVGTAEVAQSDIDAFRTQFGLPATTVTMTLVPDTGAAAAGRRGDGLEAILDLEWSGGIAKGATIHYVYVGSTDKDVDDATFYLIEENLAPVMSESYGGCEQGSLPTDADILEENGTAANLLGITYMAAAGDDGAADCGGGGFGGSGLYVDMPGSFPGVTSVGGTQFPSPSWTSAGNLAAVPALEQVWNESNDPYSMYGIGAGGGGISSIFPRPAYQSGVSTCVPVGSLPFTMNPATMRQVPDLALSAASETPGFFVECTYTGEDCAAAGGTPDGIIIGGTSAASPSFAGVVAILNQAVGTRLGNINPLLYSLGETITGGSLPLHDITSGNNEVACGPAGADAGGPGDAGWPDAGCGPNGLYGFTATTGYDCASGLGSIDGFNFVSAAIGLTPTKTSLVAVPIETTEGAPVTLTATVDAVGVSTTALGGSVTFEFESYTTTGAVDLSWELGTVTITPTSGTTAGQAVLKTAIPPGLVKPGQQWVDVIAAYSGDSHHLPSVSPKVGVGFAPISFAVDPPTAMLAPSATETFTTTGGVPPVKWYLDVDTTRGRGDGGDFGAASIDEMAGTLVVGPKAGYVEITALDSDGAEANAYVTVGDPTTAIPWSPDAGPFIDSGVPPLVDAGVDASAKDASAKDASVAKKKDAATTPKDAGEVAPGDDEKIAEPGRGCSCELAGRERSGSGAPLALGAALFGLGVLARRRRLDRDV